MEATLSHTECVRTLRKMAKETEVPLLPQFFPGVCFSSALLQPESLPLVPFQEKFTLGLDVIGSIPVCVCVLCVSVCVCVCVSTFGFVRL